MKPVFINKKATSWMLVFVVLFVYVGTQAIAADAPVSPGDTGMPSVFDQFRSASTSISEKMVTYGGKLLAALALLQVAWNGADRMIKGNTEIKSVIGNMVRTSVTTTFFFVLLFKAPTWFLYSITQWLGIGSAVVGQGELTPGDLMATGIDLTNLVADTLARKAGSSWSALLDSFSIALQVFGIRLLILFAFFVLAGQLALAMIKGYLWLCVGPLLLGFGGLKTTRDVAVNTLKAVISHGVVIITTYVIAGITFLLIPMWNDMILKISVTNWTPIWSIVCSAGLVALSAWQVPKYANDFINGSVSGGISEVASAGITAAAGGAALAAGAAGAAGMAVGAAQGVGSSLGGVMQAIGAGTQAAKDSGASGLGAVGAGVMNAASAGAGMAAGAAKNFGASVLEKFQNGMDKSLGGQVAEKIQSERGGSISMPGASPNVGTGGDASSAALSGNGGEGGGNGGGGYKPSISERIRGLHDHLPQNGDSNVSVGGMHNGMSENE